MDTSSSHKINKTIEHKVTKRKIGNTELKEISTAENLTQDADMAGLDNKVS